MPKDLEALTAKLSEIFKPKTIERLADIIRGNEAIYTVHAKRCDLDGMVRTFSTKVCTLDRMGGAVARKISKEIRKYPEAKARLRKLHTDINELVRDMREEAVKNLSDDFEKCTLKFLEAVRRK
jgi:hypothetical protein